MLFVFSALVVAQIATIIARGTPYFTAFIIFGIVLLVLLTFLAIFRGRKRSWMKALVQVALLVYPLLYSEFDILLQLDEANSTSPNDRGGEIHEMATVTIIYPLSILCLVETLQPWYFRSCFFCAYNLYFVLRIRLVVATAVLVCVAQVCAALLYYLRELSGVRAYCQLLKKARSKNK